MKRIWRAVEVAAWTAFFAFAVLLLALRFWVLPKVAEHREQIAAVVARTIGQPVKIGAIEAGWLGLRPQISLSDVRILDGDGREALVLPSVENVLSWSSLLHGEVRLSVLVIDGPRLTVRRDAAGAIYVAGLKLGTHGGGSGFTDWLLGHDEISIRNAEIEWRDEKRGAPPLALSALNLRLRNSGPEHAIGLVARPPAALGSRLELRAQLAGRTLTDPSAWSGRVYAELGATDLAAWRAWVDYPLDVREARGELRLWATLEAGALTEATADVALVQVLALLGPDLPALELTTLQGRLQAHAARDGYELSARGLTLVPVYGPPLQPTDFQVKWGGDAAEQRGSASARLIEFEPLLAIAGALPLPADVRALIAELGPTGRIADARFEWHGRFASPQRFNARARFSDFGLNSWRGAPGFAGLSGTLEASEKKGRLSLASRKAEVDLPEIFPDPRIGLDTLNGQVDWERQDDGSLALKLTSVSFANADASGSAYGTYTRAGPGPGSVDLFATLTRADGARIGRYLPHGRLMGERTRKWLIESVLAGQASDVRLRLKGDLRDFPFVDPARGQFQVTARVERGVLSYANDWPRIENVEGELQFERDGMVIAGRGGTILGARLANVRVSVPELAAPTRHLLISGQAAGPTAEFLKFIEASPVRRMTGGMTDNFQAAGSGTLRMKIDLPIEDLAATKVEGEFNFGSNTLILDRQLPTIERASGSFGFTDAGFNLHRINGRLLGAPVEITGGTRANSVVEIVAQGRNLKVADLPLERPWRENLSGATSYAATLTVREGHASIRVESSLRGVASTLPAPLAKNAGDALPLRVEISQTDAGVRDRVSASLGRLAAAEFLRRRQGETMVVQRAGVWLAPDPGQPVRLPERPGTLVYGSLAALDLDSWLALAPAGDEAIGVTVDVRVGTLDVYGKRLTGTTVRAGTDAVGWSASVNAKELSGDISYRGRQVLARLDYLSIPPDAPGPRRGRAPRPGDMPGVDLVAERFDFRGKPFGQLMLAASQQSGAQGAEWRVERLALTGADATLRGSGVWRPLPDGTPASELEFQLDASDAGSFLARAGFPNGVRGGKATLLGSLAWRGDPSTIDYATLGGELKLEATDGQFLEIDPGYGKLLSLMSLQQLPRRIGLDFSDVFSKGFKFERIDAEARVDKGLMNLKEFRMSGSAADVEMRGDVDLARETQNLRVRIIPGVGDTASTALVLVNPAVGVAAAIAQRVLKNPLGQMLAYQYAITGSWNDPKVARVSAPKVPASDVDRAAP
ncbi:MAG: hypothetical protein QOD26_512 [Betaproteobacteria bacterium]|jgi:uncharacterized protein (TIGR02099 family)|nr:hypothetical protein [Betaproteobacteria bacterium]